MEKILRDFEGNLVESAIYTHRLCGEMYHVVYVRETGYFDVTNKNNNPVDIVKPLEFFKILSFVGKR